MPKNVVILKDFAFAERGVEVINYQAGEDIVEVSDECFEVAIVEGWVKEEGADKQARKPRRVVADPVDHEFDKKLETAADAAPETKSE